MAPALPRPHAVRFRGARHFFAIQHGRLGVFVCQQDLKIWYDTRMDYTTQDACVD